MVKRSVLVILLVAAITLLATSAALAASPQEIYDDYADDGLLNGVNAPYSDKDLEAYLNDGPLHQYGNPTILDRLDDVVKDRLTRDTFPLTGFQLMMAGIVAVVLIGGGIALRRLSRTRG